MPNGKLYTIDEFVKTWENEGYGIAIVKTGYMGNILTIADSYVDPTDYPDMMVDSLNDGAEIMGGEYKGCILRLHHGDIERRFYGQDRADERKIFVSFDEFVKEDKKVNEGIWAMPKTEKDFSKIRKFIETLERMKKEANNVLGDDEFFDGLDNAIRRARAFLNSKPNH